MIILVWISTFCRLSDFQGDVIAGMTVGLTVIPQSLAYANIAKLKPQVGLCHKSINTNAIIRWTKYAINGPSHHDIVIGLVNWYNIT